MRTYILRLAFLVFVLALSPPCLANVPVTNVVSQFIGMSVPELSTAFRQIGAARQWNHQPATESQPEKVSWSFTGGLFSQCSFTLKNGRAIRAQFVADFAMGKYYENVFNKSQYLFRIGPLEWVEPMSPGKSIKVRMFQSEGVGPCRMEVIPFGTPW